MNGDFLLVFGWVLGIGWLISGGCFVGINVLVYFNVSFVVLGFIVGKKYCVVFMEVVVFSGFVY